MKIIKSLTVIGLVGTLPSCASILNGHTQEISVNSSPEGATCVLMREGEKIATIESTPQKIIVSRNSHSIHILCHKAPDREGNFENAAGWNNWFWGNLVLVTLIGMGIDAGTGNWNEYPASVTIPLMQESPITETQTSGQQHPNRSK